MSQRHDGVLASLGVTVLNNGGMTSIQAHRLMMTWHQRAMKDMLCDCTTAVQWRECEVFCPARFTGVCHQMYVVLEPRGEHHEGPVVLDFTDGGPVPVAAYRVQSCTSVPEAVAFCAGVIADEGDWYRSHQDAERAAAAMRKAWRQAKGAADRELAAAISAGRGGQ